MDNTLDNTNEPEWVKAVTPTRDDIDFHKGTLLAEAHTFERLEDLVGAFLHIRMRGIETGVRASHLAMVLHNVKRARAVMHAYDEVCNGVP